MGGFEGWVLGAAAVAIPVSMCCLISIAMSLGRLSRRG